MGRLRLRYLSVLSTDLMAAKADGNATCKHPLINVTDK